ncbi:uncharacterized protein LOC110843624 [Folsomia candida]|uniref:Uncharacterized protein n=1 Tax=Folsomia candida TaxID=158441 RepID=A0A226ERG9_FOLCA|nr:uncharacterized protein LOC110843624 [Folsomia candida]OXA59850.1 hypothetical protein Fcan01_04099 [Folsomia candida]
MSLLTTIYNNMTSEPAEQIHFINCDIITNAGNLEEVKKGLELNDMGFEIGDENISLSFALSPHIPTPFNNKLPYVYVGYNKEGGYRFGEDHSKKSEFTVKGSKGHQLLKVTTMTGIEPNNIHNVFQADPSTFTSEQSLQKTKEVETLGHKGVLVAQILGMKTVDGHNVYNLSEKYTHFDHGWDDSIFNDMIVMMTGKGVVVKKEKLKAVPTEVKFMVPIYKTVGVGEKARQVLDVDKMKKVGVQKKVYDKIVICWI